MAPGDAELDALLAEIARVRVAAERDAVLAVYADALMTRGDRRGELIAVALERARGDRPELARREAELIAIEERALEARLDRPAFQRCAWWRGFLDELEVMYLGDQPFTLLPALAAEPAARLLRRLVFDANEIDGRGDMAPIFAELAALAPRFPRLTEVAVVEGADLGDPWIDGPIPIHDVTPLYAGFPALEVLELDGRAPALGDLAAPALRRLRVTDLVADDVTRLAAARLPGLAELDLAFHRLGDVDPATALRPLLYRDFGPQLRSVSLFVARHAQAWLCEELPGTPLVRHARRLALPGALDAPCYGRLIANAARLAHVEQLELSERWIAVPVRRQLARTFGGRLVLR